MPIVALVLIMSMSGVYATWYYSDGVTGQTNTDIGINLGVFDYTADEILPGGDEVEAPMGENHHWLIELILNENEKGYGINIGKKSVLIQYMNRDGEVHCNQKVSGGHLKFILDVKNDTHGLYYAVEKVSDVLIYAYTFSTNELSTNGGTNNEIVVYRTSLEKTDKWRATYSYMGYAPTKSMSDLGLSADSGSIRYSIDISKWHM